MYVKNAYTETLRRQALYNVKMAMARNGMTKQAFPWALAIMAGTSLLPILYDMYKNSNGQGLAGMWNSFMNPQKKIWFPSSSQRMSQFSQPWSGGNQFAGVSNQSFFNRPQPSPPGSNFAMNQFGPGNPDDIFRL